ncbi:hypothetical protein [Halalkalibacter krulwichiae]|uniref:Lipoprotein n=1 Tax=Halalkalibacter krulwichiae TaxID=199441 RepID=A0A1X9MAG5_9BACI|nr:hypothetical protein [Halalkalibacter krulwichiae]ARK30397.1 hypothetical protein BkAM31D_11475 [Halalkalibacter krulwichiae]
MKKNSVILLIGASIVLSSCGAEDEANIVNDVEAQQLQTEQIAPEAPSIRQQNRERNRQDNDYSIYANEAGFYLSQTATLLEQIAPIFDKNNVNTNKLNQTLSLIEQIQSESESFMNLDRPEPFDGFHHVHLATLIEVDALKRVMSDMKNPIHPLQLTNARVYYENAVQSHKLMEREYLSITEELGIY